MQLSSNKTHTTNSMFAWFNFVAEFFLACFIYALILRDFVFQRTE